MVLLAIVLVGILANDTWIDNASFSSLTRIDGMVLITFFVVFLYYTVSIAREITGLNEQVSQKERGLPGSILIIIIGLTGLLISLRWVVDGAVYTASVLSLSHSFVGLTIVALGTSLPELATSVVAAFKKNSEIAVGNIVGSNIFNVFFILGISAIMRPIPFSPRININIGVVIFASLLLFFSMFTGRKRLIDRWEGAIFILLYIDYIVFLFKRG